MEAHRHTDKVKKLIVASCLLTRQVIQFYLTGESNQILVCREKKVAGFENRKKYVRVNTSTLFGICAEFLLLR